MCMRARYVSQPPASTTAFADTEQPGGLVGRQQLVGILRDTRHTAQDVASSGESLRLEML